MQSLANSGANTHIKVVLKDDNLGLGAKGLRHDQCTGLDAFQGLLDSLNGKPKRKSLRQEHIHQGTEPAIYGGLGKNGVRFVSGGFLEGKEQEKRPKQPVKGTVKETVPLSDERFPDDKLNDRPVQSRLECEYKAPQHQKSRQKNRHESTESGLDDPVTKVDGPQSATDSTLEERRKKKAERKLKKRKDKKIRRAAHVDVPDTLSTVASKEPICSPIMTTAKNQLDSQAALPLGGRHAVRQRYIRHKRMAMMDSRAMNEVSLIVKVPKADFSELTNAILIRRY